METLNIDNNNNNNSAQTISVYGYHHHHKLAYADALQIVHPINSVNNHLRSTYSLPCCVSVSYTATMHIPWSSGSKRSSVYLLSTSKTNIVTRFSNSILFTFVIKHFKIITSFLSSYWNTVSTPFNKVSHYNNHVTYQAITSVQGKLKYVKYNKHKHRRTTLAPRPIHTDNHLRLFQLTANV